MASSKVEIVPCTLAHVEDMNGRMRAEDEAECRASSGFSAFYEAKRGFKRSLLCWAVVHEGRTVCVFGVVARSALMAAGTPWCLGTDDVRKIWVTFARLSRGYVEKMLAPFDMLENYIDVRNTLSMKWLKWCGFQFDEPMPFGREGLPFQRFWIKKEGV